MSNSMNYTYKWQSQPQISWKGPSTNSVAPNWSSPFINGARDSTGVETNGYEHIPLKNGKPGYGFWGKARPLKQWRKQLNPRLPTNATYSSTLPLAQGRRAGVGMPMDTPGGSVYLGADSSSCLIDCSNAYSLKENFAKNPATRIYNSNPDENYWDEINYKYNCLACNPENLIIKSGKTLLNKDYYTTNREYLYSKGRTYKQNLGTGYDVSGGVYFSSNGNPLYPSNNAYNGPPYYNKNDCIACEGITDESKSNTRPVFVYKPSNHKFGTQGAVSSSTRLARLKVDTITRNGANLQTAWGPYGTNAGRYTGSTTAPYFIKSKNNNVCNPWRPSGNRTLCWVSSNP